MRYLQLLSCSDVGSCCSDFALASTLDLARRIINLIQMIVPIVLLCAATYQLIRMVINPDDKKNTKRIINKIIAATVVFFIPMIFDISIGVFPEDFSLSSCWEAAQTAREISKATKVQYVSLSSNKNYSKIIGNADDYEKGVEKESGTSGSANTAGVGAQKMINVALSQVGNNEGNGGHLPYTNYSGLSSSDPWCAAFVTWCAAQAGYVNTIIPSFTACFFPEPFANLGAEIHYGSSSYNPKPGDLVIFDWNCDGSRDHVGIVLSSDSDNIYTVEGNTSGEGEDASKCGGNACVSRKTRKRTCEIHGYATPKYPTS